VANGDFDPHPFFDHPSLLLYLLAPFQWGDEPSYLAARLVVVAIGVAGVAAAWWLGTRSFGLLAGGVAAVATGIAGVHVAYSRMAVTDVLLTTLVTVTLALLVSGRLELAGVAAGLAVAAKWPGAVLVVPLLVVGWGRWRRVGVALALAGVAFAAASPFALVHAGEAASDWWAVSTHAREGWLGFEGDSFSAIAFGGELWEALGPALVVAAIGLVVALVVRGAADRVLASFALAYFAMLLPLGSHFDRYVLPLVPVLAVLAGRFGQFAPVTILLLIVPFTWTVRDTEELTKPDTRAVAATTYGRFAPLAADPSLVPPPGGLTLALPATWEPPDARRELEFLRGRVRFVAVNGDVRDRVRAAREEHPEAAAFYDALEREARRAWRVAPGDRLSGPEVVIFRLPSSP
jgi:4-amino-4-deoxy-L-arabinose transferase-like glycosyltransferase